jgi:hypothetical protein
VRSLIVCTALWLLVTAAGLVAMWYGVPPQGAFVTTRPLRFDHRIAAGDVAAVPLFSWHRTLRTPFGRLLTSGDFTGRYLVVEHGMPSPAPIAFAQTAEHPKLDGPGAVRWVALPDTKGALAGTLDAGDAVDVCSDAKTCATALPVAAVTCGADGSSCSVAVRVTSNAQRAALLAAEKTPPLHVFTHSK